VVRIVVIKIILARGKIELKKFSIRGKLNLYIEFINIGVVNLAFAVGIKIIVLKD